MNLPCSQSRSAPAGIEAMIEEAAATTSRLPWSDATQARLSLRLRKEPPRGIGGLLKAHAGNAKAEATSSARMSINRLPQLQGNPKIPRGHSGGGS